MMVWPPQSPSLNIKSAWDYMKRQNDLRQFLWLVLQDAWNNLPAKFLLKKKKKLCASVPSRIDVGLMPKGDHTKY